MDEEKKIKIIRLIFIIVGIVLIVAFIIGLIVTGDNGTGSTTSNNNSNNEDSLVEQRTSYTYPDSEVQSFLPYINLDSDDASTVNAELNNRYNQAIRTGNIQFTYRYSEGEDYLSLVAITNRIDSETGNPYSTFETYNFDLETGSLLSTAELLNRFGKTMQQAAASFEHVMETYYEQELESMYFTEEMCDYNCFLNLRGITDYSNDIKLFVEHDELKLYRAFQAFSIYGEEQFYRNEDFLFEFE